MEIAENIQGETPAIDDLYQEVGPRLLAYFTRRHGDSHLAEDLLQETFSAALRRPGQLVNAPSPRAYLFTIARNLSIDAYRRTRPVVELSTEHAAAEVAGLDPRIEVMRSGIRRLAPMLREVLEFRLEQELSYEEIAAILEIPVGTVRSRLHAAVKQLRLAMLRGDDDAPNRLKGVNYEH